MPGGMFEYVQTVEPGLETDGYPPSDLLFNDDSLFNDDPANWYAVREYASGLGDTPVTDIRMVDGSCVPGSKPAQGYPCGCPSSTNPYDVGGDLPICLTADEA